MSTMMQTQNPDAHARLVDPVALPGVGSLVVYHMRPTEMRAGRTSVPAMVMKADRDNMRLDLLLFFDHMDQMMIQSVPPRIGNDRGWVVQEGDTAALLHEVEALRGRISAMELALDSFKAELADVLFGENVKADVSFEDRVSSLEKLMKGGVNQPAAPAFKAKAKPKGK